MDARTEELFYGPLGWDDYVFLWALLENMLGGIKLVLVWCRRRNAIRGSCHLLRVLHVGLWPHVKGDKSTVNATEVKLVQTRELIILQSKFIANNPSINTSLATIVNKTATGQTDNAFAENLVYSQWCISFFCRKIGKWKLDYLIRWIIWPNKKKKRKTIQILTTRVGINEGAICVSLCAWCGLLIFTCSIRRGNDG